MAAAFLYADKLIAEALAAGKCFCCTAAIGLVRLQGFHIRQGLAISVEVQADLRNAQK
ncbi:hypothetical protein NKJ90_22755 [Mesorhizobium sp. M0051]|uniref:hypothetical protein n=1 Tax=Mesorhizobium sp. M0051 TaxID=2956862 RepID=UPI0003CEE7BD|nr:hypothetical protein X743_00770 [Mesorhizobium sp. LNHC252B00]